jgi:hypothetical protein
MMSLSNSANDAKIWKMSFPPEVVVPQTFESGALSNEIAHHLNQMWEGTSQAVELPDYQRISRPTVLKCPGNPGRCSLVE